MKQMAEVEVTDFGGMSMEEFPGCCGIEVLTGIPSTVEVQPVDDPEDVTISGGALDQFISDNNDRSGVQVLTLAGNQLAQHVAAKEAGFLPIFEFKNPRTSNTITFYAKPATASFNLLVGAPRVAKKPAKKAAARRRK